MFERLSIGLWALASATPAAAEVPLPELAFIPQITDSIAAGALALSAIAQHGIELEAEVRQTGDSLLSDIRQSGADHGAFVVQSGEHKFSLIDQNGDGHFASVLQLSQTPSRSVIVQSGSGQVAIVRQ